MKKFGFLIVICTLIFVIDSAYAKEITIIYSGSTHAMIYPCSCPKEPDGGAARRATLIKQLREKNPSVLVLDTGAYFGGGLLDEYTQNTQLDMQRTIVNLKSMEMMQYDALNISDHEFNFGKDFFLDNAQKRDLLFLSCNLSLEKENKKILPFLIKEIDGIKIGVIGVTNLLAAGKAGGIKFLEPRLAVKKVVAELRQAGVNIIVLLSNLGESQDLDLINSVGGIDVLIVGQPRPKEGSFSKVGDTLVLRTSWQGKRLGKASLDIQENKITGFKVEDPRLSDKIIDDPGILAILPRCFSDSNCKKENLPGSCQDPGTAAARCVFSQANKISLLIITPRECITCDEKELTDILQKYFPGLSSNYLYYPEAKRAKALIKELGITGLPAYLLGREIEKEKNFENFKKNVTLKGDFYLLKPEFSGIAYFLNRQKQPGKLDLFFSLYDKNAKELLDTIREFNPQIHLLAIEQKSGFDAAGGKLEVEECLRSVCVQKYYPESLWDYLSCRAENKNSSWWEDCASGLDTDKIKACAKGSVGEDLLRENIELNKELQVMLGPTYLLDNQEIFASRSVPSKAELKKIINKR